MSFKINFIKIILIFFMFVSCTNYENEFYYNYKCKIVSISQPEYWRSGKFQGVNREWLVQSLSDTSLFRTIQCNNDSLWFNRHLGDTLLWKYCLKEKWFKIKN